MGPETCKTATRPAPVIVHHPHAGIVPDGSASSLLKASVSCFRREYIYTLKRQLVPFSFLLSRADVPTTVTSWGFPALGIEVIIQLSITAPPCHSEELYSSLCAVMVHLFNCAAKKKTSWLKGKTPFFPLSAPKILSPLTFLPQSTKPCCFFLTPYS